MTSSEQTQVRSLEKRELVERFLKEQGHTFNVFPLSFAQQRLWFLDQLYPGSPLYNIPAAMQLSGPLHIRALQHSLNAIVQRHEVLRTTFTVIEGQPVQAVVPQLALALPVIDLGLLPTSEQTAEVQRRITAEAQTSFDLTRGPLLRATLLRLGDAEHVLLLTMHHIIADGWSIGVFVRELATLYETCSAGQFDDPACSALPELPIQYADFAAWQHDWLAGGALEEQLTYWQRQLGGPLPVLALPTDHPRPAVQLFHGAKYTLALPAALTEALKALSQQEQSTLFMTLLAAFKVLLQRYTDQTDIVVGSPIANRRLAEVEELIGFFANTLVLRSDLSGNPTFRALLARVRACCLSAYTYQDVPFEKLVEVLQPMRDPSHSPLFQVLFALQNAPMPAFGLTDLTLRLLEIDSGVAKFDLTLNLEERADGLHGWFEYNTDLFDGARIARLAAHFQTLLAGIAAAPDTPIGQLPLLAAAERQQLLVTWNATAAPVPPTCIHELVAAQATRTPEACAIVAADGCLTYRALDQRATQLAHHLRALGVGPEVRVGVGLPRSAALVVGVLAILKAGGAYVPLDRSYPAERLAFMLADAQAPVLLTTTDSGLPPAAVGQAQVVDLEADWPRIAQQPTTPLASAVTPEHLAYVIYTSGSTGTPKGVEIPHAGLANLVTWHQATYQVTPADRATLLAGTAFDAAVWELWPYLSAGASLHIPDEATRAVPALLLAWLRTHGITLCFLPTPLAEALLAESELSGLAIRALLTGGDALHPVQRALPFTLVNHYGPTEYSVVTTWASVVPSDAAGTAPPIGRPIANTQVYVLDCHLQPVPIGVPGELYITGAGLARGYLNRPVLTAERFIQAPGALAPVARLYRTGDLVRYRADGHLEFLGRLDEQVKVRGFRIELGEIEAVLRHHPHVLESVVVVQEEPPGHKRLVAYVVLRPLSTGMEPTSAAGAALSHNGLWTTALRDFVRQRVPEYMVPSACVILDALPLTPNGKVDRRALPRPELMHDELETTFVAPRTPAEQTLTEIWARVLQRQRVGIHHNFFELGGHSLLATEVIAAVRDAFRVEVPLRHLFEHPTIAGLAEVIEQARRSGEEPQRQTIVPITREAHRVKLSELTRQAETI